MLFSSLLLSLFLITLGEFYLVSYIALKLKDLNDSTGLIPSVEQLIMFALESYKLLRFSEFKSSFIMGKLEILLGSGIEIE